MNCDEYENRILADLGSALSVEESVAAQNHLIACTHCQTLARQFQQLDAALTNNLRVSGVSADFNQQLAKRIQAHTKVLTEAQRMERKRQLQLEFTTGLVHLNRRVWSPEGLLAGLSYPLPVALLGWLAWQFLPRWTSFLNPSFLGGGGQNILFALVAALVFLAMGLAAAFPQRVRSLWPAG
jgi:anti-sigma factor RsiW